MRSGFPFLSDLPVVGPVLFHYDILVYLVVPVAVLVWWVLFLTRWGLGLRAVGENPTAAYAAGKNPHPAPVPGALRLPGYWAGSPGRTSRSRLAKTWAEWMTAGRGFIAVALVIFSKWHPLRAIAGALLFGGAIALQLQLQARGVPVSPFRPGHASLPLEPGSSGRLGRRPPVRCAGQFGKGLPGDGIGHNQLGEIFFPFLDSASGKAIYSFRIKSLI